MRRRVLAGLVLALALCGVAASPLFDTVILRGATSGQITQKTQAAAGTWNWNFPIAAGNSGQVLASAGGGAAPMTWVSTNRTLSANTTVSGNGADLTEDQLTNCNYTIPANTLVNTGDGIRAQVYGNFAATTDNKTARLHIGGAAGVIVGLVTTTSSGVGSWMMDVTILKSGSNTQVYGAAAGANGLTGLPRVGSTGVTDTSNIAMVVTGQNTTNMVASSITCTLSRFEFLRAP
jgi:hypothetical protein